MEQRYSNPSLISIKDFLLKNEFTDNNKISNWLAQLFSQSILGEIKQVAFAEALPDDISCFLKDGDNFYFTLFRANGFITEHTSPHESLQPLTDVTNYIYDSLFNADKLHHENLFIYSELRHLVEKNLGNAIALEGKLNSYECWVTISERLEIEHEIYSAWVINIPIKNIQIEKVKFASLPKNPKLSELANLRGFGRNHEQEAENYLRHIQQHKSDTVVQYIHEATSGSDLLEYKGNIFLQQSLLHNHSLLDWLLFTDSLYYPNLQDHNFLFLQEIDDYLPIITYILNHKTFITPKEHLLVIALENYYDFVDRTVSDIHHLFFGKEKTEGETEKQTAIENAKKEYDNWINEIIPNTFNSLLDAIFGSNKLQESEYFNTFFEWINSHSSLRYTHPSAICKIKVIETLNDLFEKRLIANKEGCHTLIDTLTKAQINYEALKKLVTVLHENKTDDVLRDKLYNIYLSFIESKDFSWFAKGDIDFDGAINNTYYFSQVLSLYNDSLNRWELLLNKHKTIHEGWLKAFPDYRTYYREAFIFCAGIGLAYNLYVNKDSERAKDVLFSVLALLVKQIRNSGDTSSIDYTTPLQFAAITIGNFDRSSVEPLVKVVLGKTDKLKYLLEVISVLMKYDKTFYLSPAFKLTIAKRINDEFWIIEQRKSDGVLRGELDRYNILKDEILKRCSIHD